MNRICRSILLVILCGLLLLASACRKKSADDASTVSKDSLLRIVVMDPLAAHLACACVDGFAQRSYPHLAEFLSARLERETTVIFGENLPDIVSLHPGTVHLIIGKQSLVLFDAEEAGIPVRPIAMLTDKSGSTGVTGLFVVRQNDPAKTLADLKGRKILFGPKWETEKNAAAVLALKSAGVPANNPLQTRPSCNGTALDVVENVADAGVISSYAMALLEGCDTIDKGSLRVIAETIQTPFITVFATDTVDPETQQAITDALFAVKTDKELLVRMESKNGFVGLGPQAKAESGWADWRGPGRHAINNLTPADLPEQPTFLWRHPMTGMGLAGIAATDEYVVVPDKSEDGTEDIFRCLDAQTGKQIWTIEYPAPEDLEYSNSPRANPVISDGKVYLLGAFGDLLCARIDTGEIVWQKNITAEFGANLPSWGMSATPLLVDDKLIVNPGAPDASLVALNPGTGAVIWKSPGPPAAYASFIVATFGGVRQIVGYDVISAGGWLPDTGERIWTLSPKEDSDFNVPTPVNVGGKLLLATENNGTRLYDFGPDGKIIPKPVADNLDLLTDCSTPVVINNLVFGGAYDKLLCLDLNNKLETAWSIEDKVFDDYYSLIANSKHVLATTVSGYMVLFEADKTQYKEKARLKILEDSEIFSHPALMPGKIYIRSHTEICCIELDN